MGPCVTAEAGRLFGRLRDRLVGVSRSGNARFLEKAAQDGERVGLVLLELHGRGSRTGLADRARALTV